MHTIAHSTPHRDSSRRPSVEARHQRSQMHFARRIEIERFVTFNNIFHGMTVIDAVPIAFQICTYSTSTDRIDSIGQTVTDTLTHSVVDLFCHNSSAQKIRQQMFF